MQLTLTEILNIPSVVVEDYQDLGSEMVIQVDAITESANCPRCGQMSKNVHQHHYHLARDVDLGNRQVTLKYNRRQFKCHVCKKPFSESLDFIGDRRRYTDRYAEMIVKQVRHSDSHNVGKNNGLTDDEVWSMVEYISKKNGH